MAYHKSWAAGVVIAISFFLCGCSYPIKLIQFETSKTLSGKLDMRDRTIEVRMDSGELLSGNWAANSDNRLGAGVLMNQEHLSSLFAISGSGQHNCYAILTGKNGTVMELVFKHNEMGWSPHGFGVAITNKGEEFRVIY